MATDRTSDTAYAAVRRDPRATASADGPNTALINQKPHRTPVSPPDRSVRWRLDARLVSDLFLLPAELPQVMRP
jgi:hypothetical protein